MRNNSALSLLLDGNRNEGHFYHDLHFNDYSKGGQSSHD